VESCVFALTVSVLDCFLQLLIDVCPLRVTQYSPAGFCGARFREFVSREL
jgi:hypothetical protein